MRSRTPGNRCPIHLLHVAALLGLLTAAACSAQGKCAAGQIECNGACVAASDPDNCGACGKVCGGETVCSQGSCAAGCAEGLVSCGRACVDTTADAGNCGGCGKACAAGATCKAGRCVENVPECKDRLDLQASGAYDADLKTVRVSGKLTKNGAAVPDGQNRGSLIFASKRGSARAMSAFGDSGEAAYNGEVFAGTYDVSYQPSAYCRDGGALPCQSIVLRKDVVITDAGALDFDAKVVTVSGKLTKNGARVPDDSTDRGSLVFSLPEGGARSMSSFGQSGEAAYRGEVFAATYDIRYQPSAYCKSGGALPCQSMTLKKGAALQAGGALDLDAKVVTVSGKLTKNGARVPDDSTDRGAVVFDLTDGGARAMSSFGQSGEATYQGEIFAGSYDIRYQPSAYCKSGGALPCQSAALRGRAAIMAGGALDFDVKVVRVSGKLTKNSAAVPDDSTDRGALVFSLLDGGARAMPSFGETGEASYNGEIFAGSYDVRYQPSAYCKGGGALPCQSLTLRQKTAVMAGGALDFDAKVVRVSGKLTENGARVADDSTDRGALVFVMADGSARGMPSFGQSGEASYSGEIFAGTYDVRYQPSAYCKSGGALPCQSAPLRQAIDISAGGALDFDAKTITLSGTVTKNGARVPDDSTDRGALVFSLAGGGARSMPSFGETGAATYRGEIFAGSYDLRYQPSAYCKSGGALPCQSFLVVGCPPPASPAE